MNAITQALLIGLLSISPALASPDKAAPAKPGDIVVTSLAEQEVEVKLPDGKTEKKRQPVLTAIPGAEVIYTTRFTNRGKRPAGNVVVTNPVPEHTVFVGGSAFGENTSMTYSLDGINFNTPDKLKVKTPDGKERTALPSEYTAIRWAYRGELAPGKTGEVGFRVRIK